MPAYLSTISAPVISGSYTKAFPNDAAGIYRSIVIGIPSDAVSLRQASATSNIIGVNVAAGVFQPLGVMESADLEVRSLTTNIATVYFFGSHPSW